MNKLKFLPFLILLSCGSPGEQDSSSSNDTSRPEVEKQKSAVMEVHDEAMERLGEMADIKAQLIEKKGTISDSALLVKMDSAITALEEANTLMFDWMHGYNGMYPDTAHIDTAIQYLNNQMSKIKVVDEKINSSIENGKTLL